MLMSPTVSEGEIHSIENVSVRYPGGEMPLAAVNVAEVKRLALIGLDLEERDRAEKAKRESEDAERKRRAAEPCQKCADMEARGETRGHYISEVLQPSSDELTYGPFCSQRCGWVAVHRGCIRSRCYTAPKYTTKKDAALFAPHAIRPSKAPRTKPAWWEV